MKSKSLVEMFIGLVVVAIGTGLLLDAFEVVEFGRLLATWWPLAVIGIGLLSLMSNPRVWWWPSLIVVIGILFLVSRLGWVEVNVGRLIWPSIIILVGLSILFQRGGWSKPREVSDDEIDLFAAFSGNEARNTSQAFKGGKATALFGGVTLDLTGAKLPKDGANIDIFTAFGGVEVKVPEGWLVKVDGLPILGGWENKAKLPKNLDTAPVLRVHGTCLLGGVSIKNGSSQ